MGLFGPLIILPQMDHASAHLLPDHDYIMVLQQWQVDQPELGKVSPGTYKVNAFEQKPNFFTINGKAFPDTTPMSSKLGEKIRMRFVNKSTNAHSMHIHGHDFQVVAINGFPRKELYTDTINVASGQRYDIEFIANNPGVWPVNGTKDFHQTNNGEAPGGMMTRLIYK
jgi:FtsP/CotA-like multicopper oxidase with cupredoxin domain